MRLPQSNIGPWAREVIDECFTSLEARRDQNRTWTAYYWTGSSDGGTAVYNRVYSHVDRLSSMLFSPVDTRFSLEGEPSDAPDVLDLLQAGGRYFNREFHRCNVDLKFSSAVTWGLIKGAAIVKMLWGHHGLEPWIVQPDMFGVLREDISDLDRQDAFCERTYMTLSAFKRTLDTGHGPDGTEPHPQRAAIMAKVQHKADTANVSDITGDNYLKQIAIGGTAPVSTTGSAGNAMVNINSIPQPMLAPTVASKLVRLEELWVQDSGRGDYTTIRMVDDLVIEGEDRHRNLSSVPGEHPYTKVAPNDVEDYFWGQSEIANVHKLQAMLNSQIERYQKVTALKADPPRAMIGFTGMTQQKYEALRKVGSMIAEETPNAKVENLAPDVDTELLRKDIEATIGYFDDVAGFTPVLLGQGEAGVRSQAQAATLARNSSPRMRDRALLVERQAVEVGEYAIKLMCAKDADVRKSEEGQVFILAQMPDGYRMTIDSHTSSPAFQEDARTLAFNMMKVGAIDAESLITQVHPPNEDTLVMRARNKAKAQAEFLAKHPEIMAKTMAGGRRK